MTKNEDLKACPMPQCQSDDVHLNHHGCFIECRKCNFCMEWQWQNQEDAGVKLWNTRPTVTPTNSAMEDAAQREPADSVCADNECPATSSTTDGDAERALSELTSANAGQLMTTVLKHWATIISALQSTRKPPVVAVAPNDIEKMFYCENYIGKDPQFDEWEKLHDPDIFFIRKLKCQLGTEYNMHRAWRKRAEEAEAEITRIKPPVDTIAVPREVSVIDTTIKSNIPEHWQVPNYGEGACIGEVVVTRFQDKQRAISQANKQRPLMPADKVRDIRDGSQRTWRIIEVSAYYDRTKIVLRDVNDEKNVITADYDSLTPYLELVAAPLASLDAVLSEGES